MQFGLVHALIGIPIGAALALSIGGAYFMRVYLREFARTGSSNEATLESTTAHTVYNGVIIGVVIIADRAHAVVERGRLMSVEPVDIDIVRDRSVTITFDDGMVCEFPVDALRSALPVRHVPRLARARRGGVAPARSARRPSPSCTPS